MEVYVSKEVPDSDTVRHWHELLSVASQHYNFCLQVGNGYWELVAFIVPGATPQELCIQFALRDDTDHRVRALVGWDEAGSPIPIAEVLEPGSAFIASSLYLALTENIGWVVAEHRQAALSDFVH